MYHSFVTGLAMFQCNTLCCYTTCGLRSPLAKGYVPPCTKFRQKLIYVKCFKIIYNNKVPFCLHSLNI